MLGTHRESALQSEGTRDAFLDGRELISEADMSSPATIEVSPRTDAALDWLIHRNKPLQNGQLQSTGTKSL